MNKKRKTELMKKAFKSGIYESLNKLEFNYLVAILKSGSTEGACKKVGINPELGSKFFDNFVELYLIDWNKEKHIYNFLPEFEKILSNYKIEENTKSIFGSPKALEVYRILKKKFAFVFPEIPLCAFINKDSIEHLFKEPWHENYFLLCRLDFLICDSEGNPKKAVEYHGGYHNLKEQKEKDVFKERILYEVDILLLTLTYKDLKGFKEQING